MKRLNKKRYKLGKNKEDINLSDFYISNAAEHIFGIFEDDRVESLNMKGIDRALENIRNLSYAMYQDNITQKMIKFKK